jgi:hypothetical protein
VINEEGLLDEFVNILAVDRRTFEGRIVAVPERFDGACGPRLLWRLRHPREELAGMSPAELVLARQLEALLEVETCHLCIDYHDALGDRDVYAHFDPRPGCLILGFHSDLAILLRGVADGVNDGHPVTLASWCAWPREAAVEGTARLAEATLDWMDRFGRGRAPVGDSPLTVA